MKLYGGVEAWLHAFFDLSTRAALEGGEWSASQPGCFTPGKEPLVPTGQGAGWVPELVWTQC